MTIRSGVRGTRRAKYRFFLFCFYKCFYIILLYKIKHLTNKEKYRFMESRTPDSGPGARRCTTELMPRYDGVSVSLLLNQAECVLKTIYTWLNACTSIQFRGLVVNASV